MGAEPILEATYGDERAPDGLEQSLVPWLNSLIQGVIPHLQPMTGFKETEGTELAEPIYKMDFLDESETVRLRELSLEEDDVGRSKAGQMENGHMGDEGDQVAPVRVEDAEHDLAHQVWKPDDWGWVTLKVKERATGKDWWQDAREIELELEDKESYVSLDILHSLLLT